MCCGKCWTHPRGIPNCSLIKERISLANTRGSESRKNPNLLKNKQGGLLYTTQFPRQPTATLQITFFYRFLGIFVTATTATRTDDTPALRNVFDAISIVFPVVSTSSINTIFLPRTRAKGRISMELCFIFNLALAVLEACGAPSLRHSEQRIGILAARDAWSASSFVWLIPRKNRRESGIGTGTRMELGGTQPRI